MPAKKKVTEEVRLDMDTSPPVPPDTSHLCEACKGDGLNPGIQLCLACNGTGLK